MLLYLVLVILLVYPYRTNAVTIIVAISTGTKQHTTIRTFPIIIMIVTGTQQCATIRFARYPSATAKAWFSQCCVSVHAHICRYRYIYIPIYMYIYIYVYIHICMVQIHMVALCIPGTYSTRKYSSWCQDIHRSKDPESKKTKKQIPKIQNPKFQKPNFSHQRNLAKK